MSEEPHETNRSPEDVGGIADVVQLLANNPNVVVRRGPLRTQGRMTFGYEHAGADGIGLFVLADDDEAEE